MYLRYLITSLLIFISTTRSWYGAEVGLSFDNFSLIFLLIIVFTFKIGSIKLMKNELYIMYSLIFAITFGLIRSIFQLNYEIKIFTAFSIILYSFLGFLIVSNICNDKWKNSLEFAIRLVLSIHVFFLFVQLFGVLIGYDIDFYLSLTGNSGRNIGGGIDNFGLGYFYRPSGLFDEPGTYCANITILLCLYLIIIKNKINFLVILTLISVFFTFSTQGVFNAFLISSILLISFKSYTKYLFIILIFSFGIISSYYAFYERFYNDDFLLDSSSLIRLESVSNALSSFLGNGFIIPKIAVADSTTFIYWYWYFGVSIIPLFIVFAYISLFDKTKLGLLFFILFTSKIPPTAPLYWLAIAVSLSLVYNENTLKKLNILTTLMNRKI